MILKRVYQMLLFFFNKKASHACRFNRCFRYHKYYPALQEDIKNFAIFLLWLFWRSFSSYSFCKSFGFLAGVVSKLFAIRNELATNHNVIIEIITIKYFNRFACFWPKGYQLGSLGKSHQNGDYLKEAMRKIVFPPESNLQPLDYRSTAIPLELEKTPPRMLNFGYLNPATCLLYDCNNKSIKQTSKKTKTTS